MSAFNLLKSACKASAMYKNFDNIEIGEYKVLEFKFVDTKYGRKVVVVTPEFLCFLPERFGKSITTQEAIDELNKTSCVMKYQGKDPRRKNLILLDFEKCVEHDAQELTWEELFAAPSDSQLGGIMTEEQPTQWEQLFFFFILQIFLRVLCAVCSYYIISTIFFQSFCFDNPIAYNHFQKKN